MDNLARLVHLSEDDLLSLPEKVAENIAIAFDSVVNEATEAKCQMEQMEKKQGNLYSLFLIQLKKRN